MGLRKIAIVLAICIMCTGSGNVAGEDGMRVRTVEVEGGSIEMPHLGGVRVKRCLYYASEFYMGTFPISEAQYAKAVGAGVVDEPSIDGVYADAPNDWRDAFSWDSGRPPSDSPDETAVTFVDNVNARRFCFWLTEASKTYRVRLPDKVEWKAYVGDLPKEDRTRALVHLDKKEQLFKPRRFAEAHQSKCGFIVPLWTSEYTCEEVIALPPLSTLPPGMRRLVQQWLEKRPAVCRFSDGGTPEWRPIARGRGFTDYRRRGRNLGPFPATFRIVIEDIQDVLRQHQRGLGYEVRVVGPKAVAPAIELLEGVYVRNRALVQIKYVPASSAAIAVKAFIRPVEGHEEEPRQADGNSPVGGSKSDDLKKGDAERKRAWRPTDKLVSFDMLFVRGTFPEKVQNEHGDRFARIGIERKGPERCLLGARAVAVVVNPTNKLKSLTLDQVSAIYGGQLDDWVVVGKTGLEEVAGGTGGRRREAVRQDKIDIHAYAPYPRQPGVELFEDECLPARKWRGVKRIAEANELLAKVAMDPQAIACIDATLVPDKGGSVKMLGLQIGRGDKVRITFPGRADLRSGMYPLSERLWLYGHPEMSFMARDFVEFITSGLCDGILMDCGYMPLTETKERVQSRTESR